LRQTVGVDRIEIVHRAGEMLKAHHRRGAFLTEVPVGEAHTADILELVGAVSLRLTFDIALLL
jgi:hypothetical protein